MSKKIMGACLALLALSQPAFAQELKKPIHTNITTARETLDTSMARLAAKAAFQPAAQPTRQELLGMILLMSLRDQRGNHT